ncbi:MAG TPA: catalase family protein [Rhizomicrobium sp.]|jgi:hypothetical protein
MGAPEFSDLISNQASGSPPWEAVPDGEATAMQSIAQTIETQVRAAAVNAPARRDAHPKAHGVVRAEFRILDNLPDTLRKGLFARPATYPAWIRLSSSNGTPQNDSVGDGRGMAIKLMGVEASRSGTQDFIMISYPTFITRNAIDYIDLAKGNLLAFLLPGWNPFKFRLHELLAILGIKRQHATNVLNVRFWSETAYLFGDIPYKFSCKPVGTPSPFNDNTAPNFLRENLVKALNQGDAQFDFCVQLRTNPDRMPVEDPVVEWLETESPFIPIARITIPKQVFDTPEQNTFGENLSYTPWHGLDAHRPLGGINRVRRTVYETISRLRHTLNHAPRVEPTSSTVP